MKLENFSSDICCLLYPDLGKIGEQINYVPMKDTLNQGARKKMESDWAKALKDVPPKKLKLILRAFMKEYHKDLLV